MNDSLQYQYDYYSNYEIQNEKKKYEKKGLTGLVNLGNKCFLNSIIQCLSNNISLTDYFLSGLFKQDIKKNASFANLYNNLLIHLWNINQIIKPKSFIDICLVYFKNYNKSEQEDSFEFLLYLLDYLHKDLSYKLEINIIGNIENKSDEIMKESLEIFSTLYKNNYSIINKLFYGFFYNKITFEKCDHFIRKFESYNSISLPINENEQNSIVSLNLYNLLDNYFIDNEIIDYKCEKCDYENITYINRKIWTFPDYIIFHLKRFDNNGVKLNNLIDFPIDDLNMTKYISYEKNDSNNYIYSLYAVNYHSGNINNGHYYSSCKNLDNNWYAYNDENVSKYHDTINLVTQDAYILFYYRKFIK